MRHEKYVKTDDTDHVADEVCRLAKDLIAGRKNAPGNVGNLDLTTYYQSGRGYWWASVPVKPPKRASRIARANGATSDDAVVNLLRLLEGIPIVEWK